MNIVEKPITDLKAYENNPRIHTEKQIQQIMKSITLTHGLRQPIVIDADNVVVCGHGRPLAAQRLGMVSVPCELVDDLTEDEIRAYRVIDNLIAESDTDWEKLNEELDKIEDVDIDDFDLDIPETFSVDDIQDFGGYDKNDDDREFFNKTFTFPIDKKKAIISYLSKHQNDVIERIIKEAETDG